MVVDPNDPTDRVRAADLLTSRDLEPAGLPGESAATSTRVRQSKTGWRAMFWNVHGSNRILTDFSIEFPNLATGFNICIFVETHLFPHEPAREIPGYDAAKGMAGECPFMQKPAY